MAVNSVMDELIKGQECTDELKDLLAKIFPASTSAAPDSGLVWTLLDGILGSISRARIALEQSGCNGLAEIDLDQGSPLPPLSDQRSEEYGGKRKVQRRSGYRRRAHPYSSRKVLNSSIDDGFAWRKYGQKEIYSSKFPRSYFRCTHKFDRDCQATRQVQQSEEDPSLFVITYMGEHTCRDAPKSEDQRPSIIINFEAKTAAAVANNCQLPYISPPLHSLKQECEEEEVRMLPEVKTGSDNCDVVTSGLKSPNGVLDVEFSEDPAAFDLDDILSFDQLQWIQDY